MTKKEKEKLIQQRIEYLKVDRRGFSQRKLYSMAKQFVEFHHSKKMLNAAAKQSSKEIEKNLIQAAAITTALI